MCHGVALPSLAAAIGFLFLSLSGVRLDHELSVATFSHAPLVTAAPEAGNKSSGLEAHADLVPFIHVRLLPLNAKNASKRVSLAQISDLHVSKFSLDRQQRLKTWFSSELPALQPSFVLVSGFQSNMYKS
jgi:hypothetical protein